MDRQTTMERLEEMEQWLLNKSYSDLRARDHYEIVGAAIELLKAQEPVKAYRMHGEKVIDNGEKVFTGQCTNCSCYLVDRWKACPACGKAVIWE